MVPKTKTPPCDGSLNPFGTIYSSCKANEKNIDFFIWLADFIRQSITH